MTSRITLVMPSASPTGGAEEAFLQLVKSPKSREFAWQIIFLEFGPLIDEVFWFADEVHVVCCGRTRAVWGWWRASSEIGCHAKSFGSSLIIGWMTKGHVYGGLAAWRFGISAAWFQMGLPENGMLDCVSRWIPAKTVFACSEFAAREQRLKQPHANVVPIPLGVEFARFDLAILPSPSESRRQLGLPLEGRIVGIVGRLQRWKGMHLLIEALPLVLRDYPDAHCLIVGGVYPAEPGYETELHKLGERLGIADRVIFAGAQKNVPLWMQAMDVFVHASDREPFGLVVIEALALGKPVLSFRPGGTEEILEALPGCMLCNRDNGESTARAILHLLSRPENDSLLRQARALQFSSERFAQRVVKNIFTLVINKNS